MVAKFGLETPLQRLRQVRYGAGIIGASGAAHGPDSALQRRARFQSLGNIAGILSAAEAGVPRSQ